jgi:oligopeptide/dipeptide ABC transporter ATP-binding protein
MQMDNDTPLIEVKNLKTWFPVKSGLLQRTSAHVRAVDDVSFSIPKGKTLALVGESGCGKTILRLIKATGGEVLYGGQNILALSEKDLLPYRKKLQIIFQDPANSLNPRMLVKDIVGEGLRSFKMVSGKADYEAKVTAVLDKVGLGSDTLHRYPHEFSGGQRQRICIARALAVDPEFIVCDEATSALDVSVQASILNLLKELQDELGLTYLFITHDLSVVEYLSDRVAVMYLGQLVDEADTNELFTNPKHPYTQALMASAPSLNPDHRELTALGGEVPSPMNPPSGCRFHTRCEKRFEPCDKGVVPFVQVNKGRCRCLLYKD